LSIQKSRFGIAKSWLLPQVLVLLLALLLRNRNSNVRSSFFFFFVTLGLELSDTKVYQP